MVILTFTLLCIKFTLFVLNFIQKSVKCTKEFVDLIGHKAE